MLRAWRLEAVEGQSARALADFRQRAEEQMLSLVKRTLGEYDAAVRDLLRFGADPRAETEPTPRCSSRDRAPIPGSSSGRGRGDPSAVTPRAESASRVRPVARVHRPGAWPM